MSGAPVLRHSRVRPQDVVSNAELGAEWIAEAHGLSIDDVRAVLAFHAAHRDELPIEYVSPERMAFLGLDRIDWSDCPLVERRPDRMGGVAVLRNTPVRPVDLVVNQGEGAEALAFSYSLSIDVVRSVLRYYVQHKEQLETAV